MTKNKKQADTETHPLPDGSVTVSVSNAFGDPQTALDKERYELYYSSANERDEYYRPSIPFEGLVKMLRVNPQHGTLPSFRAEQVVKFMKPNAVLSRSVLLKVIMDDQTSGNGFFKLVRNAAGRVMRVEYLAMINTRRAVSDPNTYGWLNSNKEFKKFKQGEILHVMQHDPAQQIYGVPHWVGAMQSILLGEDVRIFPRLFFKNGGSTGDLVATSGLSKGDQDVVESTLNKIKGIGRFKRIILQFARGKIDEILKVIPYSTGSDKIDFSKLASLSATDILEAWRVRPELPGMQSDAPGNALDLEKVIKLDYENQTVPLQQRYIEALNAVLPPQHPLEFMTWKEMYPDSDSD